MLISYKCLLQSMFTLTRQASLAAMISAQLNGFSSLEFSSPAISCSPSPAEPQSVIFGNIASCHFMETYQSLAIWQYDYMAIWQHSISCLPSPAEPQSAEYSADQVVYNQCTKWQHGIISFHGNMSIYGIMAAWQHIMFRAASRAEPLKALS